MYRDQPGGKRPVGKRECGGGDGVAMDDRKMINARVWEREALDWDAWKRVVEEVGQGLIWTVAPSEGE